MAQIEQSVYTDLDVRPIINAAGSKTVLGGSRLSPRVRQVAEAANRHYVVMEELQQKSGEAIARRLGADMALVTPGCAAAMTLGVAGILTGTDNQKIAQLPDTSGMADEIIIQKCQRYSYDRALTLCGAKLVEVGDEESTTEAQVEAAINDRTAAIHYLGTGHRPASLTFETLRDVAHRHGIYILVDAASVVYPLERMTHFIREGADLVCFGAKYFGGFNGTGVLCGRRGLMEAAIGHTFISFETRQNRAFGRPFKLDRQEIVGVVAALTEWFEMDHEERLANLEEKGQAIRHAVGHLSHVRAHWRPSDNSIGHAVSLELDEAVLGKSAADVQAALMAGSPAIATVAEDRELVVIVNQLYAGEAEIVGQRLQEVLVA